MYILYLIVSGSRRCVRWVRATGVYQTAWCGAPWVPSCGSIWTDSMPHGHLDSKVFTVELLRSRRRMLPFLPLQTRKSMEVDSDDEFVLIIHHDVTYYAKTK